MRAYYAACQLGDSWRLQARPAAAPTWPLSRVLMMPLLMLPLLMLMLLPRLLQLLALLAPR